MGGAFIAPRDGFEAERAADFVEGEDAEFEVVLARVVVVLSDENGGT